MVTRASAEKSPRRGTAALRTVGAWLLWMGVAAGGASAGLDLLDAARHRQVGLDAVTGVVAAGAFGILLAAIAALPVAGLAALLRRGRLGSRVVCAYPAFALLAGTCVAWWLTDPLRRRMTTVYLVFCIGTGVAVAIASWLGRKRQGLPEVVAASILAFIGASMALAMPMDSYEELQDLAFVVALAGALAAFAGLLPRLERWHATPALVCVALVAALGTPWIMDALAPQWRANAHLRQQGAARLARALRGVVDLDRDGYSSILQGADCDDLDGSIHPLALDRPGGKDQNCNGVDAPATASDADRGLAEPAGDASLPAGAIDRVLLITVDCWRADALDPDLMPEVSAFAAGGMRLSRVYSAGSSTMMSLPMVVGIGPQGPWVGEIAASAGVRTEAAVAGAVPVPLWGFRKWRGLPSTAERVTDAALEMIDAFPSGRHLIWLHYFDLHELSQYRGPSTIPSGPAQLPALYRIGARQIDRAIGRLFAELDRRGLLARTMVVMTGDHGEGLGAHGVPAHGRTGFEEVVRVPGILRGPGIPAATVAHLASHRDLPATLLGGFGLASEAAAAEKFGRSWLRLRALPRRPLHRFVLVRSGRKVSGRLSTAELGVLVDERFKLVAGLEDGLFELYDLHADPRETTDLSDVEVDLRQRLWRQLALAWDLDYQSLEE